MPLTRFLNVTMDNISNMANKSNPAEFAVVVNNTVYGGLMFFLLLLGLMAVIFIAGQRRQDQPLINLMYAATLTSLPAMMFRIVYITIDGVYQGLLTDPLLWIFPIIAASLATVVWQTNKE